MDDEYTTPRSVTFEPPVFVIFPPKDAEVGRKEAALVVVKVGGKPVTLFTGGAFFVLV